MSETALVAQLSAYGAVRADGRLINTQSLVREHPEYDDARLDEIAQLKAQLQQLRDAAARKRKKAEDETSVKRPKTDEEANLVAALMEYDAIQDNGRAVDIRTLVRDHPEYSQDRLDEIAQLKIQLQRVRDAAIQKSKPKPEPRTKVCSQCGSRRQLKTFISADATVCLVCQSDDG